MNIIKKNLYLSDQIRNLNKETRVIKKGHIKLLQVKTFFNLFKDFIYLFLERGEGREKERERNINVWLPLATTHWPLLGT